MIKSLVPYRFELFFITQFVVLFGSLFVPSDLFGNFVSPILLILNLAIGILFAVNKKVMFSILWILFLVTVIITVYQMVSGNEIQTMNFIKFACFFVFYIIVSFEIIKQVAKAETIERNVILGLISGYLCIGLLGFFMFLTIEIIEPQSFSGLVSEMDKGSNFKEHLLYFSYVTLLTIGYGEIIPVSDLAQKASVLVALVGQFYLVILTAIVVGKYINQQTIESSNKNE